MANTTNFSIEKPSVGGARNSWGGIANVGTDKIDELLHLAMPLGTIQMYPLSTAPVATANGGTWLICDGGTLVRATYPDLHTLITNTYGTYPDGDTFLLPDLRARVPVGYNVSAIGSGVTVRSIRNMATTADGTEDHILAATQIPKHLHPITDPGHIHPVTDVTHFHVGDQTGGKTGSKALTITDPGHGHEFYTVAEYQGGTTHYETAFDAAQDRSRDSVENSTTGISIADHDHSLTTDAKVTGISTTTKNPDRITTTGLQADGDASHNNMQPYITVQYIILAKHPTF